jgi:hypothetical protein
MTRGQDGSLLLSCMTLSFTTPRRFIPAHSAACQREAVERVIGDAPRERAPIRCDLGVGPAATGYGSNRVVVVSTPAASAHPPHPTTDSRALPPFTRPVRNPAAVTRRTFIRGRPSSIGMAIPTITSGVRLLLRLCRHAGRRLHDARLGDPVFARLRRSDAIRRPVRPFDPRRWRAGRAGWVESVESAPLSSGRISCALRLLREMTLRPSLRHRAG